MWLREEEVYEKLERAAWFPKLEDRTRTFPEQKRFVVVRQDGSEAGSEAVQAWTKWAAASHMGGKMQRRIHLLHLQPDGVFVWRPRVPPPKGVDYTARPGEAYHPKGDAYVWDDLDLAHGIALMVGGYAIDVLDAAIWSDRLDEFGECSFCGGPTRFQNRHAWERCLANENHFEPRMESEGLRRWREAQQDQCAFRNSRRALTLRPWAEDMLKPEQGAALDALAALRERLEEGRRQTLPRAEEWDLAKRAVDGAVLNVRRMLEVLTRDEAAKKKEM